MNSLAEPKTKTDGLYNHMKETAGVEAARTLARELLKQHEGNVASTAIAMGATRPTIRRARDGGLEDKSKAPESRPRQVSKALEKLVLSQRKQTGYGRIRLSGHLMRTLGKDIKPGTIQNIFNRHSSEIKKQSYRRPNKSKPLYDYEALLPFEQMQLDVKFIEDYEALGKLAFIPRKIGSPAYQWTAIDAKTKIKFLAYSHSPPNALYGQWFMLFNVWWLRAQGVNNHINIRVDNGSEWASGSKRKEEELNELLSPYNASLHSIPAGKKYLQGIVERTHRVDDEEFYRPHLIKTKDKEDFMVRAQRYQDTFNVLRTNYGVGMKGVTPAEKLKQSAVLGAERICAFPVLVIDDLFDGVKDLNYYIAMHDELANGGEDFGGGGGKDVLVHYRFLKIRLVRT